ncbi:MAG: GNAT family N-acetyltransferase [Pseudomonadota bacterium]
MNVQIRPADTTDTAAIPLIYSAGPPAFDYIFGTRRRSALDFLTQAFPRTGSLLSFDNHVVAEVEDQVLGCGAFYDGPDYDRRSKQLLLEIVRTYGWQAPGVIRRSLQFSQVVRRPDNNSVYLNHLGVAPESRGLGIGKRLLEYGIALAKSRGRRTFSLDVALDNPRAQQLYERMGLNVVSEHAFKPTGTNVPNGRRMELLIEAHT